MILKEMDEDFTEDELDEIIAEVWQFIENIGKWIYSFIPDRHW